MGAFVLLRRCETNQGEHRLTAIKDNMKEQGFSSPQHLRFTEYDLFLYDKQVSGTKNYVEFENGDFCASTGTLIYGGRLGERALIELYSNYDPKDNPPGALLGSFCVVIRKSGRTFLFIDRLGIYKVYSDENESVWSSSFLATLTAIEKRTIDVQSVYEYVFNGATYGNATVIQEIKLLDCGTRIEISDDVNNSYLTTDITAAPEGLDDEASVDSQLKVLRTIYSSIVGCFGDKIDTALSGGYDSRLTLALLLEKNTAPKVHVYGRSTDSDVKVAKTIDREMDLALVHTDKSKIPLPSEKEFAEVVKSNFLAFDGYPPDGIFVTGADLLTRRERCSNGRLMLNGGGGEIYRNFFYLPDRSYTVKQFLYSFYAQFDPNCCTSRFSERRYYDALGDKVRDVLGTSSNVLKRFEIELLYPLFRCRYWMGRNNALNNRFGYALTPFIEYEPVKAALRIPIKEKNFGRIQGMMINNVNPGLASFESSYGHSFSEGPSLSRKITDSLTLLRPPWLRKRIYRIKKFRRSGERPTLLSDSYVQPVIGTEFSFVSSFFHVSAIRDPLQLNRICTLEYLFQEYPP